MIGDFAKTIKNLFTQNEYNLEYSSSNILYIYDDADKKRTYMITDKAKENVSFVAHNIERKNICHICVDGGIIEFGLEDYVGDHVKRGRNDCIIFNDDIIVFLELKMNVKEETSDRGRWNRFYDGMNQIEDFYLFFRERFVQNGITLSDFYTLESIHPIICMRNPPKGSVQRNTLKEKFRLHTDLKIETAISYNL